MHAPPLRSPTTVRSSPIAGADSAAAPATPDSLLSNGAPSPPADACPVCLCQLPSDPGARKHRSTIVHWPHCGHALHLGCVAHHVANVRDLRCPTCRARWLPCTWCRGATARPGLRHHVPSVPQLHGTEAAFTHPSVCCLRLFRADSRMPPRMPDGRLHEVPRRRALGLAPAAVSPPVAPAPAAVGRVAADEDPSFVKGRVGEKNTLPHRHMHWAPIHSRQSGRWRPEWVCMRCNATVDEDYALLQHVPEPLTCPAHGPRRLALDLRKFSRGWVCCQGSPPEVRPGRLQPLLVGGAPEQPAIVSAALLVRRRGSIRALPTTILQPETPTAGYSCCCYMQLRRLHPSEAAWEAHEPASDTRLRYRASLANLDPFLAENVLARPCCLFRVPPHFCDGAFRRALHVALDLIRSCARTSARLRSLVLPTWHPPWRFLRLPFYLVPRSDQLRSCTRPRLCLLCLDPPDPPRLPPKYCGHSA